MCKQLRNYLVSNKVHSKIITKISEVIVIFYTDIRNTSIMLP